MELLQIIAKQLLTDTNADGKIDVADVTGSLKNLLSDGPGDIDFSSLITKFKDQGLADSVSSWLGDGENSNLSVESITDLFDGDKLTQFAGSLGVDVDSAKTALANAIPTLIDKVSNGGNLVAEFSEKIGEVADAEASGLLSKVKKLFGLG